MKLKNSIMLV